MNRKVLLAPIVPVCFAVAAFCFPVRAYSVEQLAPIGEASSLALVANKGVSIEANDSIETNGAFAKDPMESTGDSEGAISDDVQTPSSADGEDGSPSSVPETSSEPSPLPSEPRISDLPAADIDEGVYVISNVGSNRVLDVSGGSSDSGANVQQYGQNDTPAQRWRIEKYNGHYLLVNVASGRVLDVSGAKCANGTNVQQYELNHTNAQLWDFVSRQDGGYFIKSCLGDYVLDISGGSVSNGANAQIFDWNATNAQVWSLIKIAQTIDDGLYRLGSMIDGGQVVDVPGGSLNDTAQVQLYGSNDTLAQYWTFAYNKSTGYYTVRSAASGKVLDCRGGGVSNGTAVQQYVENGTTAQWWRVVANADGSVSLISAKSGLALDVPGANSSNGSKLQLYAANGTLAQKWTLSVPSVFLHDGLYEIYSRVDGNRLVDVAGGSKADDAKLQVWNRNGTLAQKWSISVCDDGSVLLKCANSGKYISQSDGKLTSVKESTECSHWVPRVSPKGGLILVNAVSGTVIDLTGGNAAAGTALQLYFNNLTAAQAWHFVSTSLVDDGYYVVVNQSSDGRVLDVAGGSCNAGTRVQLYSANGTNAQKWRVRALGNGAYSLTAFVSGKALDVPGGNASNGSFVQQWDWNGSGAQMWVFRLADEGGIAIYSALNDGAYALADTGSGLVLDDSSCSLWRFDSTVVSEQPYADANAAQKRLVDIAYSVPSPGYNLCSEWISRVFNAAGYGYADGDACDMFWAYCRDSNRANLKVGMIIAVPSHSNTWAGSIWGHIAIYIGDGKVIENIGRINVRGLDDWVNYYGTTYTPLWGWYRNIALC